MLILNAVFAAKAKLVLGWDKRFGLCAILHDPGTHTAMTSSNCGNAADDDCCSRSDDDGSVHDGCNSINQVYPSGVQEFH